MRNEEVASHSSIVIKRSSDRFQTNIAWLDSNHSFSFGHHYDSENTHHGLLLVSNDDIIRPGTGFQTHPHRDMEIVTWVLDGELEHKDSEGNKGIIYPGLAQRMSAGRGIWHSEMNPSQDKEVRLVQMWVPPDTEKIQPGYEQLDINRELSKGGLVPIASGQGHNAAISIRQKDAVLWGGRLKINESVKLPEGFFVHLYIAKGSVQLDKSGILDQGHSARITQKQSLTITAKKNDTEVLIWESQSDLPKGIF